MLFIFSSLTSKFTALFKHYAYCYYSRDYCLHLYCILKSIHLNSSQLGGLKNKVHFSENQNFIKVLVFKPSAPLPLCNPPAPAPNYNITFQFFSSCGLPQDLRLWK